MVGMAKARVDAFTDEMRILMFAAGRLREGETELTARGRRSALQICCVEAAGWMVRVLAGRETYTPEEFIEVVRGRALEAGWLAREQYPAEVSEHHGWFAAREAMFWEAVFALGRALEVPPLRIAGEG